MITPAKGVKKQILGGMFVCLCAVTALLSKVVGFELDIFYVVISIIGGCLFFYGTVQKNNKKKPAQHESIDQTTRQFIISGRKDY